MSSKLKDIEAQAMELPGEERARLAERLIATLDQGVDEDVEAAWLAEAERRYQAYREGKLTSKPAEKVFEEASSKL